MVITWIENASTKINIEKTKFEILNATIIPWLRTKQENEVGLEPASFVMEPYKEEGQEYMT